MKYCKSCGAALLDGFRFCVQCGAIVDPGQPEAPAAGPVAVPPTPDAAASVSGMPEYIPEREAGPVQAAPAEPAEPVYAAPVYTEPVYAAPAAPASTAPEAPVYAAPAQPVPPRPAEPPVRPGPSAAPEAPAPKGRDEKQLLGFDGAFVALLLFCLPAVGLITAIIWALGGAKNQSRKNLARAYLLLILAVCLFCGCMALLVWLIAGDQLREFLDLFRSVFESLGA